MSKIRRVAATRDEMILQEKAQASQSAPALPSPTPAAAE
jgi:hypothetical protein